MGLDISAYSKVKKIDCVFDADGEPIDSESKEPIDYDFMAYANSDFPDHHEGLEHKAVYSCDYAHSFRAGSYSGYNAWRECLAKMAGYVAVSVERYGSTSLRHDYGAFNSTEGPFWHLINFSDCEGVIGSVISKKILADFIEHEKAAESVTDGPEGWFLNLYREWKKAFEMAADDGAVVFR